MEAFFPPIKYLFLKGVFPTAGIWLSFFSIFFWSRDGHTLMFRDLFSLPLRELENGLFRCRRLFFFADSVVFFSV